MALATQEDVEAVLGRALSESEQGRTPSLLAKASATVIGFTGQDFEPDPYPEAVVAVVAEMVARVVERESVGPVPEHQQNGPFMSRFSAGVSSGGVWLTTADKLALRMYRRGGGMTSVQLVGDRYNVTETT